MKVALIMVLLLAVVSIMAQQSEQRMETINPYDNVGYWFPIMERVIITPIANTGKWEVENQNGFPVQITGRFYPSTNLCIKTQPKIIEAANGLLLTFPKGSYVSFELSVNGKTIEDFWPE